MIEEVIIKSIDFLNQERNSGEHIVFSDETPLFHQDSNVDSLTLVSLIMEIEMNLSDSGIDISLTDDENMGKMDEPFKTIGSLKTYIKLLMV
jgi:acyl carrier protein